MTSLYAIVLTLIGTLLGAIGPIYWKKGANKFSLSMKGTIQNYNLIFGGLIWGVSFLPIIWAFKYGELTVLAPLVSTGYIWVSLFSTKLLNEKMNKYKWLGILFIILGTTLIGLGS